MFDVLVVGGGPAGAVTAMCLARAGVRVALVEATSYDTPRLGETMPPEINPVLQELGLAAKFRALRPVESSGVVSVWGTEIAAAQDFVANPHGTGWRVDRNAFDSMLSWEAANAGATVIVGRRAVAPQRSDGVWRMEELSARFLVDATGRTGLTLPDGNKRDVDDLLLAIALLVSYPDRSATDNRTYIEAGPSGWWYSGLLPSGDGVAMFFTDPETYNDGIVLGEQLSNAPLTRGRLGTGRMTRSKVAHAPSSCRLDLWGDAWLAVGDSASSYDPLSGRGLLKALRQASIAVPAAIAALDGDTTALNAYAAAVRQEFAGYVRQRRSFYAMERRWESSGFWSRRRSAAPL